MISYKVHHYTIQFNGCPQGYVASRIMVKLYDEESALRCVIRFSDPEMVFEQDFLRGETIYMHLPSSSYLGVMDLLRNEKPIYIAYQEGKSFLRTQLNSFDEGSH